MIRVVACYRKNRCNAQYDEITYLSKGIDCEAAEYTYLYDKAASIRRSEIPAEHIHSASMTGQRRYHRNPCKEYSAGSVCPLYPLPGGGGYMANRIVTVIQPQLLLPSLSQKSGKQRVAAYARVSTDSDKQMGRNIILRN